MYQSVYMHVRVCLTRTWVVHDTYMICTHFIKKRIMTTYVCVMYVFDIHVHALNLFVISIFTVDLSCYVRVWRLILKKIVCVWVKIKESFFLKKNLREIQQLTLILTFWTKIYRENFLRNICKLKNHFVTLNTKHNRKKREI